MWTPRRIVRLLVGAGVCLAAFLIYSHFLGWIDGLPVIPERYLVAARPDQPIQIERLQDRTAQMLRRAFGANCAEVNYRHTLRLEHQGLTLAFHEIALVDDRAKLSPFSIAVFGKKNATTGYPEINTVHCDEAIVTFDHPIKTLADMTHGKMTEVDFLSKPSPKPTDPRQGTIHVIHNHATPNPDDDVHLVAPGPVHFKDSAIQQPDQPQLWTNHSLRVTDHQTRPPSVIEAQTLKMFLEPEALKSGGKQPPSGEHSSGVRRIELGNVRMNLCLERSSNFLVSGAPKSAKPEEKAMLSIQTLGAFRYDARANRAEFTIPPATEGTRHFVDVVRSLPQGDDQLRCDRLELLFRRPKDRPLAPQPTAGSDNALKIAEAHATGERVVLLSKSEEFQAYGTELTFRQEKREVELRGAPMSAIRKGNRIDAPLLFLHQPDPNKPPTTASVLLGRAQGPGIVFLNHKQDQRTVEARWHDELLIERENDRDRITLNGSAGFEDRPNGQWLRGDQIRLWMPPAALNAPPTTEASDARPERLQVSGHVTARTPELVIHDTPLLVVHFQDVMPMASQLHPLTTAPPAAARSPVAARVVNTALPPLRSPPEKPLAVAATPPATPKKPVRLSARFVETTVRRNGEQADLDRVYCRAQVHVSQEPATPGERGLDLAAHELLLTHTNDGDVLRLTGIDRQPARVEVTGLNLSGPVIVVNQRDNRAEVEGAGRAIIQTSTNLNGEPLDHPVDISIDWNGRMAFVADRVSFHGGVCAYQETVRQQERQVDREVNRVVCPCMDVYLDRAVSFSQMHRERTASTRGRTDERPNVKKVICHRGGAEDPDGAASVIGDVFKDQRRVRYHRIDAPEITFENETKEVTATCSGLKRGEMRLFQLGDNTPLNPGEKPIEGTAQVFKLTHVRFNRQMRANNRNQSVTFSGSVQINHAPTDNPNLHIDPDRLPEGAFTMTCQTLEVAAKNNGQGHHEMRAEGKAAIQANDFSGQADVIKYDESKKQQVIFDSKEGNPALLNYIAKKGQRSMEVFAKKITYWREMNRFQISGGSFMTGAQ